MSNELNELFQTTGRTDGVKDQDIGAFEAPDLSAHDYTEHAAGVLANVIEATKLFETIETTVDGPNQIHIQGRVKTENENVFITQVVRAMAVALHGKAETYFGKQYFIKEGKEGEPGQFVFAWNLAFGQCDAQAMTRIVAQALDGITPKFEVLESPLMGAGTPEATPGGKRAGASMVR